MDNNLLVSHGVHVPGLAASDVFRRWEGVEQVEMWLVLVILDKTKYLDMAKDT